jgi:hypothetical protein
MNDDAPFSRGPARRPVSRVADPPLQWSTGLQTTDRRIYTGWSKSGVTPRWMRRWSAPDFSR